MGLKTRGKSSSKTLSAFRFPLSARTGQALIEVLVAISILTVGFLGIVTLLSHALALNRVVSDNYTGTYLAAEGIEIAKNIIDANHFNGKSWNAGLQNGNFEVDYSSQNLNTAYDPSHTLFFDPRTKLYGYQQNPGAVQTTFVRRVGITLIGQEEVQVDSEVQWVTRGGGQFGVTLEDHFYNWR